MFPNEDFITSYKDLDQYNEKDEYGILNSLIEDYDMELKDFLFIMPYEKLIKNRKQVDNITYHEIENAIRNLYRGNLKQYWILKKMKNIVKEIDDESLNQKVNDLLKKYNYSQNSQKFIEFEENTIDYIKDILSRKNELYISENEYNANLTLYPEFREYIDKIQGFIRKISGEIDKLRNYTQINREYCLKNNLSELKEYDNTRSYTYYKMALFSNDLKMLQKAVEMSRTGLPNGFIARYATEEYADYLAGTGAFEKVIDKVYGYDDINKYKKDLEEFAIKNDINLEEVFKLVDQSNKKQVK